MALLGKTAVVTGAVKGTGRALVEALLERGAKVAMLDKNETAGEKEMEGLANQFGGENVLFLQCNMESEDDIIDALQKTVDKWGGIDIMVNNAGILDEESWEKMLTINLIGTIRGTYAALKHMSLQEGGHGGVIINIASMAGLKPLASTPVYTSGKSGIIAFTRAMAAAAAALGYGVRFNALCPGFVQTGILSDANTKLGRFQNTYLILQRTVEASGILNPFELIPPFMELVEDEARNGEALTVLPDEMEGGKGGKHYMQFPDIRP